MTALRAFVAALTFLTIFPAPRAKTVPPPEKIGATLLFYPLVGLIVGLLLAILAHVFVGLVTPLTAGVLITLCWARLTGGLHLDGVADVADALYSSRDRARALEIMKDSRIGAMGAIALFAVLALKVALLTELGGRWETLLAATTFGRWGMVAAATTSRYARPEGGLGSGLIQPNGVLLLGATLWLPLGALLPDGRGFLGAALAAGLVVVVARAQFQRRFGGLTGDCIGAIGETTEVAVLLAYAVTNGI